MRVTHLIPLAFGGHGGILGGAERYALELARHMAREVPTRLVCFGPESSRVMFESLEVQTVKPRFCVGTRGNPFSLGFLNLLRWAGGVHCHQNKVCASSLAAMFCRASGRKVFATDLGGAGRDISSYVSTDRWYHGHLHISKYSRLIAGHGSWPRAHVVYGGVASDKFFPDPSVGRDGSVLYVGRLVPHKGIDILIRALPPDMRLNVVGTRGSERYLDLLHELAAGKQVTFVGDADDKALVGYYRRALCIVLPSVYRTVFGDETRFPELLGQTLLEGMACGTPAICSNVAAMPEIVQEDVTGFVVPGADPDALRSRLQWLRDHPTDVERMGRAAQADTQARFAWPTVVRRCLGAYGGAGREATGT